jgi:protein-L-isoaspartate(D-aspartate) O-methyltransferase
MAEYNTKLTGRSVHEPAAMQVWKTVLYLLLVHLQVTGPILGQTLSQGPHPAFAERIAEREQMVREGIENYPYQPVTDPKVLAAMRRVPRHVFVPEEVRGEAYRNSPLLIGHNQTISQPFIVAHMTEMLELQRDHKVLEIGTGSGYQAAVLAELCDNVYTVEIIPPLGRQAESLLRELGYDRVHVKIGDGYEGWPEYAPYDRMIVTCAPDDIPTALIEQLAPEGRMVIPVGKPYGAQYMVLVTKDKNGQTKRHQKYPVRFVPMTGKALQ